MLFQKDTRCPNLNKNLKIGKDIAIFFTSRIMNIKL